MFDTFKNVLKDVAKESMVSYYEGRYDLDTGQRRALDKLELAYESDLEAIKARYRQLSKKFHPDNIKTGNQEQFLRVKEAYDVLKSAFKTKDAHE